MYKIKHKRFTKYLIMMYNRCLLVYELRRVYYNQSPKFLLIYKK